MADGEEPKPTSTSGGVVSGVKNMLNKAKDSANKDTGFTCLLKDNQITLKNLLVCGVTVGLQLLLSREVIRVSRQSPYSLWNCFSGGHSFYSFLRQSGGPR